MPSSPYPLIYTQYFISHPYLLCFNQVTRYYRNKNKPPHIDHPMLSVYIYLPYYFVTVCVCVTLTCQKNT
jgi:hypothetical protein